VKAPKTSGGRRTPVRHTIPLGIVIFLVVVVVVIVWEVYVFLGDGLSDYVQNLDQSGYSKTWKEEFFYHDLDGLILLTTR